MRFEIRPPYVVFHDDKPGNHAIMFSSEGERFTFCSEASSFSDRARQYAWAFEGAVKDGDKVVFATEDRDVAGIVRGGSINLLEAPVQEARVPIPRVESRGPQEFRPRPIQMARPK